jgi:hypothetical protein
MYLVDQQVSIALRRSITENGSDVFRICLSAAVFFPIAQVLMRRSPK